MALLVVEADQAVGEDEGGVGGGGAVGRPAAAVGLELVAKVAGKAAIEVEGQLAGELAQAAQLAVEVVEDRLVVDLDPTPPLDPHLARIDLGGDDRAQRPLAVADEGEASALTGGAAVQPEGACARAIEGREGALGVGQRLQPAHQQLQASGALRSLCLACRRHRVKISRRARQPPPRSKQRRLRDDARPRRPTGGARRPPRAPRHQPRRALRRRSASRGERGGARRAPTASATGNCG